MTLTGSSLIPVLIGLAVALSVASMTWAVILFPSIVMNLPLSRKPSNRPLESPKGPVDGAMTAAQAGSASRLPVLATTSSN
jgi:hypothetical protein